MESVVRLLLIWMVAVAVAAVPTQQPPGAVIPSPKDSAPPAPTQPISSTTPQGHLVESTTPNPVPVATTRTIHKKIEKKVIPAAVVTSVGGASYKTQKRATEKKLSPVKSVNGHPTPVVESSDKVVLQAGEHGKKDIHKEMENADKIPQNVRVRDIQKKRVLTDETKTESMTASQSVLRASAMVVAPPSFVHSTADTTEIQDFERAASKVYGRRNSNTERVQPGFRIPLETNTDASNKETKKESEVIKLRPMNSFDPVRLVAKKIIPNSKPIDHRFTIQSRMDHDVLPFPGVLPPFTKPVQPAFRPSHQFDKRFPDRSAFLPSRPPALANPFIEVKQDRKKVTSKSTETDEILPIFSNKRISNAKPSLAKNANTDQTGTVLNSKKKIIELNKATVTSAPPKRKPSTKPAPNNEDSSTSPKDRPSPTPAPISSRTKTSKVQNELPKVEPSRNPTRVALDSNAAVTKISAVNGNSTVSDEENKAKNTMKSSSTKLSSPSSEISWSNIITQKPAHLSDKITIVKESVVQKENEEPSKLSKKTVPTKEMAVIEEVSPAIKKVSSINQQQKPVALPLKPAPLQLSSKPDKLQNTVKLDGLNFKLPTSIRSHGKGTPKHVEGDTMVAASQVSLTQLASPVRTERIRGSPKVQQVLKDLNVNNHQVVTVTNEELEELLRSAPASVKLRNFDSLDPEEKKMVMKNLQVEENHEVSKIIRQPEQNEREVSPSLIRPRPSQRRPSVNVQASKKPGPAKHTAPFQDEDIYDVKKSEFIKISGEKEFLKYAQSGNFFADLGKPSSVPVHSVRYEEEEMFPNPDMRVTKLSPVQVMRNVGDQDNLDGLAAMLSDEDNSRDEHGGAQETRAPVRDNSRGDRPANDRHHDPHGILTILNSKSQEQRYPVPTSQLIRNTNRPDQRSPVLKVQLLENKMPQQQQRQPIVKSQLLRNKLSQEQLQPIVKSQLLINKMPQEQPQRNANLQQLLLDTNVRPIRQSSALLQQQQEIQKQKLQKQEQQIRSQLQQELREQGKLLQKIEIQEENQRRAQQLQLQLEKQKEEQLQKQRQQQIQLQLRQQEELKQQLENQKKDQLQNERQTQLEQEEEAKMQQQQREEQLQNEQQKQAQLQQQEKQKMQQQLQKEKEEELQKQLQLQKQEQQIILQQQRLAQEAIIRQQQIEMEKQKQQNAQRRSQEEGNKMLSIEGRQTASGSILQIQRYPSVPVPQLNQPRPSTVRESPLSGNEQASVFRLPALPHHLPLPEPVLLDFLDHIPENIDDLQSIDGHGIELQMSASVPGLAEALLINNREAVYPEHDPRFFPRTGYNIMPYFHGFPAFGYFNMDVHNE